MRDGAFGQAEGGVDFRGRGTEKESFADIVVRAEFQFDPSFGVAVRIKEDFHRIASIERAVVPVDGSVDVPILADETDVEIVGIP